MEDIRALTGIVIDPGHGGTDSGAVGNDMLEKIFGAVVWAAIVAFAMCGEYITNLIF